MADKAFITPKVLKWARESARMSLEVAAAKVNITVEKLEAWEDGSLQPTIKQAETLAKAYRRPFALLFFPEIPYDFHPLQDYRRKDSKPLGTASIFIIREIQQKQNWLSDVYKENGEIPLSFVGKFSLNSNPVSVAKNILETLNISPNNYSTENPIREWIEGAESKGIFVSRISFIHSHLKLDSEEIQGFTIADKYAPFVFVNSDDWDAPQLFTLVHELAHIWIAESGISNDIDAEIKHKDKFHPVELFCNEVAANALMPIELMNSFESNVFDSGKEIFRASKKIGVSTFALLVRALSLKKISVDKYRKLKQEADAEFKAFVLREELKKLKQKDREKKTGPNYYTLLVNKNSHSFTRVVMDAFKGGYIQPTLASTLLNTKINNFSKLESFLYK